MTKREKTIKTIISSYFILPRSFNLFIIWFLLIEDLEDKLNEKLTKYIQQINKRVIERGSANKNHWSKSIV